MSNAPLQLDLLPLATWFKLENQKLIIAGPCGAETEDQVLETAKGIAANGKVKLFRAGVWKPRSRPGSFEGKGEDALKWLNRVQKETGLLVTVEVANKEHVELALKYGVDVLWIGARTTVNPFSVQEIADVLKGVDIPVFVKNPVNADLALWIGALERMNRSGIKKLGAIHRGFHTTMHTQYRNAPMWELAIELKTSCPALPIICDPSHIAGRRDLLQEIAQRALDLDMDGLMIETHRNPDRALSDAAQQLTPHELNKLLEKLVIREPSIGNSDFAQLLFTLREVIDEIDQEMIQSFARRMQVVERIGEFKKEHGVTILQIERWLEVIRTRTEAGIYLGLDKDLIVELCQLLHKASIRKQTEVMLMNTDLKK